MSTSSAQLIISLQGAQAPAAPVNGGLDRSVNNGSGGARWTNGPASGQINRVYQTDGTLAAAATDSYNVITAGALKDLLGATLNLVQLKGLVLTCLTGSIKLMAPAANFLSVFEAASHGVNLTAGQTIGFDLGALGITVSTNGKFDITDTFGGAGSTYSLELIGSN